GGFGRGWQPLDLQSDAWRQAAGARRHDVRGVLGTRCLLQPAKCRDVLVGISAMNVERPITLSRTVNCSTMRTVCRARMRKRRLAGDFRKLTQAHHRGLL